MSYEPNLAQTSVELFGNYEINTHAIIANKNLAISELTAQMEDLHTFLQLVSQGSEGFTKNNEHEIDLGRHQELLKRLKNNPELHHIFPPTQFAWVDEEIPAVINQIQTKLDEWNNDDNLKRLIHQRIEGVLQRKIHETTEDIMLTQQDLSKALELFNRGLQRMHEQIRTILQNILRAH